VIQQTKGLLFALGMNHKLKTMNRFGIVGHFASKVKREVLNGIIQIDLDGEKIARKGFQSKIEGKGISGHDVSSE
jgi:hypothetical protein